MGFVSHETRIRLRIGGEALVIGVFIAGYIFIGDMISILEAQASSGQEPASSFDEIGSMIFLRAFFGAVGVFGLIKHYHRLRWYFDEGRAPVQQIERDRD